MTHITYKTAKRIKEFLGESAPEPMDDNDWYGRDVEGEVQYPAYQLHDLLSKGFCKEMWIKCGMKYSIKVYSQHLFDEYFEGGLPAVEKALTEMMGEK